MNTKNNKRKRQSKERIEKVFVELLQTKELSCVTVSDICKLAEINRSTFYANYLDIYDLADKVREHLEQDVAELYHAELTMQYNSNDYLKLFYHIKDNQLFYKTYFKLGYDNDYQIMKYDTKLAEAHFNNRHIHYHMEFFKAGFNKIIQMWLSSGCVETPEEMDEIIQTEYRGRAAAALNKKPT